MKIFNIILFISLTTAKLLFCMGDKEESGETIFQLIPIELYGNIGKQGIVSIINESPNIFTAVEKVTEFLKKSRLISKAFSTQLTQSYIYNDLIKTFKDTMKAKFASDLSHLNQEELDKRLQLLGKDFYEIQNKGRSALEEISNEAAKLIVAGASPNLVITQDNINKDIYVDTLLFTVINSTKLHKLIPLVLIYGADVNGKKANFGSFYKDHLKLQEQGFNYIIESPLSEAIYLSSPDNINVIQQLINYKVDLNAKTKSGHTLLQIASANDKPDIVKLFQEHGAK